jgi:hypothetical protein
MDWGSPDGKTTGTANLSTGRTRHNVVRSGPAVYVGGLVCKPRPLTHATIHLSNPMNRLATLLLLGGVALLVSWAVAPAAPSGQTPRAATPCDQSSPVVAEVNAQGDRLRERLADTPKFPPPQRDPFRFGLRNERKPVAPPALETPEVALEPAALVLPKLLAIIADGARTSAALTAVFGEGESVRMLKAGDTIDAFVVRTIGTDFVELAEPATSKTHRLSLR